LAGYLHPPFTESNTDEALATEKDGDMRITARLGLDREFYSKIKRHIVENQTPLYEAKASLAPFE
jgi:hypothetical protein